jgi:glycosyltransferase involved in cell wall biosynthesis
MLEKVWQQRDEFDIVHFHIDYLHFPLSRRSEFPHITTLHGRLNIPDLIPIYREFSEMPVVSISLRQRQFLPHANWVGNVYHGLPENSLPFNPGPGKYLAFLGRVSPEKRPDRAIEIALRAGFPLKMAAKVDPVDRAYFDSVVQPQLGQPGIEFVGEIGDGEKADFLGNAIASLAPIDWPEPFGLNMIEAMACGTPTVAFGHGSVPEIIDNGISGVIVHNVEEAVQAVRRVATLSRRACRKAFERRFTVSRMVDEYLAIYEQLTTGQGPHRMLRLREEQALKEDVA